jgi:hypothetical protein
LYGRAFVVWNTVLCYFVEVHYICHVHM